MKNKHQTIYLVTIICLVTTIFAVLFIFGSYPLFNLPAALSKTAKDISISVDKKELIPFNILSIKGKNFDQAAATSAIFTTQSGRVFAIPAITVSSGVIEALVPPAAYSETENAFTQENVLLKVIQIKDTGGKLSVTTSKEISGLTITSPKHPSVYENSALISRLPKGALTRSFLAASLQSLKDVKKKLPSGNAQITEALAATQSVLEQFLTAINAQIKNQGGHIELQMKTGTVTFDDDELTKLDEIYAGLLGAIEERHFLSYNESSPRALIQTANAVETSECQKQMQEEDPALANIYEEPCQFQKSFAGQGRKAGAALPAAAKFTYSLPLMFSVLSLSYAAEQVALSNAAQIILTSSFSFITETLVEGKATVSNAATSISKAIGDQKIGLPLLEVITPGAKLFYEISKVLPKKTKNLKLQRVILPTLSVNQGSVQLITPSASKTTIKVVAIPITKQSNTAPKGSAPPSTPKSTPQPTPLPVPLPTPAPTPKPSPAPAPAPAEPEISISVDSTNCEIVRTNVFYVDRYIQVPITEYTYRVTASGKATGPVGIILGFRVNSINDGYLNAETGVFDPSSWTGNKNNRLYKLYSVSRAAGDAETTSWTLDGGEYTLTDDPDRNPLINEPFSIVARLCIQGVSPCYLATGPQVTCPK